MTQGPSSYGRLHAGDCIRGEDGEVWGVVEIIRVPRFAVTVAREGYRVTGYPATDTPVTVVHRADTSAEFAAAQALIDGFGAVEILGEKWGAA